MFHWLCADTVRRLMTTLFKSTKIKKMDRALEGSKPMHKFYHFDFVSCLQDNGRPISIKRLSVITQTPENFFQQYKAATWRNIEFAPKPLLIPKLKKIIIQATQFILRGMLFNFVADYI